MPQSNIKNFHLRLQQQREKCGMRKQELAERIGVSITTIQQYENGQLPKGEFAVRIAEVLDCSLDWLLAGRATGECNIEMSSSRLVFLPLVEARLNHDKSGFELSNATLQNVAFCWECLCAMGDPDSMVLLHVTGDSMQPRIFNNDMVLIDQSQTAPMPGNMYAVGVDDMVYIKVIDSIPGKLLLSSINPSYGTIEIDTSSQFGHCIKILGRAVWVGRKL